MTEIKHTQTSSQASPKDFSFNKALARLQQLVDEMDNPDLDLKDAISKFKEATVLSKKCKSQLKEADLTIKELMNTLEELETEPSEVV